LAQLNANLAIIQKTNFTSRLRTWSKKISRFYRNNIITRSCQPEKKEASPVRPTPKREFIEYEPKQQGRHTKVQKNTAIVGVLIYGFA